MKNKIFSKVKVGGTNVGTIYYPTTKTGWIWERPGAQFTARITFNNFLEIRDAVAKAYRVNRNSVTFDQAR
jgi:hypothetical protein